MKRDDPRHGTAAGWQVHLREGKRPCKPCREAHAAYMREYRQRADGWRDLAKARQRAHTLLAQAHPEEFRKLYEDAKRGVA